MNGSLATGFGFGIGRAIRRPMKNLYSDFYPDLEAPGNAKTRGAERPQKIRIVFENDVSARGVKIPIRNGHIPAKVSIPELRNHNQFDCLFTDRATS